MLTRGTVLALLGCALAAACLGLDRRDVVDDAAGGMAAVAGSENGGSATTGGAAPGGAAAGGTEGTGESGRGPSDGGDDGSGATAGSGAGMSSGGNGAGMATGGTGGRTGTGGMGAAAGLGGRGSGGTAGMGGAAGLGGRGSGGTAGMGGAVPPLDCGSVGVAIENGGPPQNRVNLVIVGDGYTSSDLDTTFIPHIQAAIQKRFTPVIGQVYGRYRKFVNICALKTPSTVSGIPAGLGNNQGCPGASDTAFDCCGDDGTRLAFCNTSAIASAISQNVPETFEVDWRACVLNSQNWWNTGGATLLWAGGNRDAAGAAIHEGGHSFHQLADEYGGSNTNCATEFSEVNSTAGPRDTTNAKWGAWVGFNQSPGTGMQGFFQGSRYCSTSDSQYRPSDNSMMNSLFGTNENTSFNAVSREKMIMDIWRIVRPIDSTNPPTGNVTNPPTLTVNVIDPEVISVDWYVDGTLVAADGGPTFDVAARGLTGGMRTVQARAYDNADSDLVRHRTGGSYNRQHWMRAEESVEWNVTIP